MKIALIAHDKKKEEMIKFAETYENLLKDHELFATGTTGQKIMDATSLKVTRFQSGPLGGDQQIGGMVAQDDLEMVIFLRDPLTAQPHEPDVSALLRLCDVYTIPLATNIVSAKILMEVLEHKDIQIEVLRKR